MKNNGESSEDKANRLENVARDFISIAQDLLAHHTYKKGIFTASGSYELPQRIKRAKEMAEESLAPISEEERKHWLNEKHRPELMSDEELCEWFASTYKIHSNPAIYQKLKMGHDEILKRLKKLRELQMKG